MNEFEVRTDVATLLAELKRQSFWTIITALCAIEFCIVLNVGIFLALRHYFAIASHLAEMQGMK